MAATAKKVTQSGPAPRIHPEIVKAVKPAKKKKVQSKAKPKASGLARKKAEASTASAPKHKRAQLLSIRDANSVIDQTRIAFSVSAIGSIVGIILGASIPLTTYVLAHYELKDIWSIYTLLVLGGLLFSAKNVYKWSKDAFRDPLKAFGFVALIEGTMIFSKIQWLGYLGLGILVAINAIASGANLVIKPAAEKPKPSW